MKKSKSEKAEAKSVKKAFNIKYYFDNKYYGSGLRYLITVVLILAISVVLNMIVADLPVDGLYSDITVKSVNLLSEETKELLSNVNEGIDIYFISKEGGEKKFIEKLLKLYDKNCEEIAVTALNPVEDYKFIEKYSDGEAIDDNGIIVCSGSRHKVLQYEDYVHGSAFKLEDYLNSAIEYVGGEELSCVYQLISESTTALGDTTIRNMLLDGFEVKDINLGSSEVPNDCCCLIINGVLSDLSLEETNAVVRYIKKGGDIFLSTDYTEEIMKNVNSIVELYGASFGKGVVAESNSQRYAVDNAVNVIPTIYEDEEQILTNGVEQAIMHNSMPIEIKETSDVKVQKLLEASETSFYSYKNLLTGKIENGMGPFTIGAAFEKTMPNGSSRMVWISSAYIAHEGVNEYTDGSNITLVMNSICWMGQDEPAASVYSGANASKYIIIGDGERNLWKLVLLAVIPGLSVAIGAFVIIRRRKR